MRTAQIYLWYIHLICGDYARADAAAKRAFEINPDSSNNYVSLMYCDQYLGRLDQAKAAAEQSRAKKLNSPWYPLILYVVDFLQNDPAGMEQQAAAAMGTPGVEDQMFFLESETAAHGGPVWPRLANLRAARPTQRDGRKKRKLRQNIEGHNSVREGLVGLLELRQRRCTVRSSDDKGKTW